MTYNPLTPKEANIIINYHKSIGANKVTTYKIAANKDCKFCHGRGYVTEWHPYGSTVAGEDLTCDCVLEQLPDSFDDYKDEIDIEETGWTGSDGPEFSEIE